MMYASLPSGMNKIFNQCTGKMKVEGTGTIKAQPDIAEVVLGVVTENKELKLAQEENTTKITAVLRSLREKGIPSNDIQTQVYNITPQYDYIEGKQIFRGYRVEHMLEVIIRDMNKIGEIIDAAVQNGANQVSSIKFSVSNPSFLYQKALKAAVDNALAKARTLGGKLNIDVSHVPVQIVEKGYESVTPVPMMFQAAAATPVQSGQIEITAQIEAIFSYRPLY